MKRLSKLVFLVFAQFAVTSIWFAGNAIYPEIQARSGFLFDISPRLTIAVQLGFIVGTLVYAVGMIPDRFSPSRVFLVSSICASLANLFILNDLSFWVLFVSRFFVGFFLAGIYPVGMKIASDWFKKGLGNALGFLVGALVIGSAFPHYMKGNDLLVSWHDVVYFTSFLAIMGGVIVFYLVGDGPNKRPAKAFSARVFVRMFKNRMLKRAAFGYLGHMWELYAFWAFIPTIIGYFNAVNEQAINVFHWSFLVIAIGAFGCVVGGVLSRRLGSCRVAFFSMLMSATCGVISLFFFGFHPIVFLTILSIWGLSVVADSPQFSSVISDYADSAYLGSTLTIVNCLGFSLTIISIELLDQLVQHSLNWYWVLAIGPVLGLIPTGKIAFRKNFPAL
ncbi:MAG: MFS transporter [Bacteroidota bacterium]